MEPIRTLLKRAGAGLALASLVFLEGGAPASPKAPTPTFESHWQDGRAELDGYQYTVTRYGQARRGTAVMVFVTEPFSESKRVKVDDPAANPSDTFEALKLNFIRDFQTGIYDYNTMVSLFVRSRDFSPVKISFSSAEWCGHVYEEMIFSSTQIADSYRSYFEGESREAALDWAARGSAPRGITEEELLVKLRNLRGEWIRPGDSLRVPFLPSSFLRRLAHARLGWSEALIARSRATETISVPAGSFATSRYRVTVPGMRVGRFWIEQSYPHRVIRWEWKPTAPATRGGFGPGEALDAGALTGSARLPYWKLHNEGEESYLRQLGLAAGVGGAKR